MIITVGYILLVVYCVGLIFITAFCLMQFHLLYYYKKQPVSLSEVDPDKWNEEALPFVTIQLPIYNERYVIERLLDNIVQFDYPKDRFEIHVLDDSTDDTVKIAKARVQKYVDEGFNIKHITRTNRQGYKAGALKDAMGEAKGEFIAIFDADFLPKPDFLRKTLPYFTDEKIGVVQTRWEHINQDYSLITKLQAFQLNVHFTVEQKGRYKGNLMLQFNGTAGIWRRETIESAGGWEADTLTEDLDLSYRAQMKGWKIIFLEDIVSPAELPAEMNGLKSQQFRWMKGGAETAKKMLPTVWKSDLSLGKKIHATFHLLSSSVFLFVFATGFFSVPMLFLINDLGINKDLLSIFMIALLSIIVVYYVANVQKAWVREPKIKMIFKFVVLFPIFLALSMGLSLHNSIAVLQGFIGRKSAFIRTPKFDITGISDTFKKKNYLKQKISPVTIVEGLLSIYFLCAIIASIMIGDLSFIIFHFLLLLGYGTICYYTIKHTI